MSPKVPLLTSPLIVLIALAVSACTGEAEPGSVGAGGASGTSAGGSAGRGENPGAGGGGAPGQPPVGGSPSAGAAPLAGSNAGGAASGGTASGGTPSGGVPAGGAPSGGIPSGGAAGASGQPMGGAGGGAGQSGMSGDRPISFGTRLDAATVVTAARSLAQSLAKPGSASWRAKGDQHRTYRSPGTNAEEPYRLYVPTDWDGISPLPLAMFLHGAGNDESSYLEQNGKQMLALAQEHGFLLVSPLGGSGAYGNFLRLSAPFGNEAAAAELMAGVTAAAERANELSEQDVLNVLELVQSEYPIDPTARFLLGHSMGSGGTWYIGGKYASYWRALAPMSGPFVQERGYPWEALRPLSLLVTEGTRAPSLSSSKLLAAWLTEKGFTSEYREVDADHAGMVALVLPDVFRFFAAARKR